MFYTPVKAFLMKPCSCWEFGFEKCSKNSPHVPRNLANDFCWGGARSVRLWPTPLWIEECFHTIT